MPTTDLECSGLTKQFDDFHAVKNVSFAVPAGSFFSILGPSGCGKTTIMRMIAGFLEPSSGDIKIRGKSIISTPPNKRPVSMVFQHLALFPMMNVADNIGYGLRRKGIAKAEITQTVGEILERIGLPGIGNRKINELSGGQKQRVAIARCMVLQPDVLLLDEPLGALDLKLREHMKVELKALQSEFATTFVYITHDQSEALVMSDQIAVMNAGKFEQIGTAQDLYFRPQTPFVAGFIGDSNRWRGKVQRVDNGTLVMQTENGMIIRCATHGRDLQIGDIAEVFVRPESIRVSNKRGALEHFDNHFVGKVTSILFNGAASRIAILANSSKETIEVNLPQSGEFVSLAQGDEVSIAWSSRQGNCFPVVAK